MSQPIGSPLDPEAFAERVMAAVRKERAPTPARTILSALRLRSIRDATSALMVAWHLGTVRTWSIAPRVRARSMALVLAAVCLLGTGTLAAAAAIRVAAEPVVELLRSGINEYRPVENDPAGVDHQGPSESNEPVPNESGGTTDVDNGQSGTDDPGDADIDNGQSDADEPGDEDADNGSDDDEPANDEADDEPANDEPGDQDADNGSDDDEPADDEADDQSEGDAPGDGASGDEDESDSGRSGEDEQRGGNGDNDGGEDGGG